jgi:hypothetical protein
MAHPAQVAYYQELARNVAAMQSAQIAFDNRAEPANDDAEDTDPVQASDEAMALAGRADRAYQAGDRRAAADLYRSAAEMLISAAEVAAE